MVLAGGVAVGAASAAAVIAEVDARFRNLVASNPSIIRMVRTPQPAAGDRSRVERMSQRKHPPTRHALRLIRDPHLASTEVDGLAGHPNVQVRMGAAEHPQTGEGTLRSWWPTPCWGWRGLPTAGGVAAGVVLFLLGWLLIEVLLPTL